MPLNLQVQGYTIIGNYLCQYLAVQVLGEYQPTIQTTHFDLSATLEYQKHLENLFTEIKEIKNMCCNCNNSNHTVYFDEITLDVTPELSPTFKNKLLVTLTHKEFNILRDYYAKRTGYNQENATKRLENSLDDLIGYTVGRAVDYWF